MKVLLFGLGFGLAFGSWRQAPAIGQPTATGLVAVVALGFVLAFLAGRSRRRRSGVAVAVATASAEASAVAAGGSAAVHLHFPTRDSAGDRWGHLERMPWMTAVESSAESERALEVAMSDDDDADADALVQHQADQGDLAGVPIDRTVL